MKQSKPNAPAPAMHSLLPAAKINKMGRQDQARCDAATSMGSIQQE